MKIRIFIDPCKFTIDIPDTEIIGMSKDEKRLYIYDIVDKEIMHLGN